jgi:hypothetical protein
MKRMSFQTAAIALALSFAKPASALDLHAYWDGRCNDCHGHAGEFARRFLTVQDGKLQGRHHVDNLAQFLSNHYLAEDLVEPVSKMLAAQVASQPRFKEQCGRCHENGAALARESLMMKDGVLVSRQTGRPIATFLRSHARTRVEDVPFFVDVLARVLAETGGSSQP